MASENASACCGPQAESTAVHGAKSEEKRLDIDFLYLDLSVCERCRSTESTLDEAVEEVSRVLELTGVEVGLHKIHVASEEQAVALGLLVSPTIRVNGRDIQMRYRESLCEPCGTLCECEGGVSCREWEYRGQWHPSPPEGLVLEAILEAAYGHAAEERRESEAGGPTPLGRALPRRTTSPAGGIRECGDAARPDFPPRFPW